MKKSILLFTTIAGIFYLSLSSYNNGASLAGHAKAKDGCGGAGCHATSSTNTAITVVVKEKSSGNTVTEYEAGVDYEVTVTGANASAAKYGYMARFTDASTMQAGTFSNPSSGSKVQLVSGGVSVVEHSGSIAASSGSFTATFDWKAPTAGTGNVSIDVAVNAVNGNGIADVGDQWNTTSQTLTEKNTSVGGVAKNSVVSVYPNPVHNVLNVDLKNNVSGTYELTVLNINGQTVETGTISTNGTSSLQFNTTDWKAGLYIIHLSKDGAQQSIKIQKL